MKDHKWIETDKHVYGAIYREHCKDLQPFGTISDLSGAYGRPLMMTEWGFKNADFPIMKIEQFKDKEETKFYLCCVKKDGWE
jgi:hypothetical protein